MSQNPIEMIYQFNQERGLLDQGYDDKRECAFAIEESLEGFDLKWLILDLYDENLHSDATAKEVSRSIIRSAAENHVTIPDVDRLDKHLDTIVFAFGSIFKLGLSVDQAMQALQIVMEANLAKSNEQDEFGKNLKGDNFTPPEEKLQKIIDLVQSKK